jgi:hypothetical protein
MSEQMVSELINIIGVLHESGTDIDGIIVVNSDAVIEVLRGVIQDEWLRTGVLVGEEE